QTVPQPGASPPVRLVVNARLVSVLPRETRPGLRSGLVQDGRDDSERQRERETAEQQCRLRDTDTALSQLAGRASPEEPCGREAGCRDSQDPEDRRQDGSDKAADAHRRTPPRNHYHPTDAHTVRSGPVGTMTTITFDGVT